MNTATLAARCRNHVEAHHGFKRAVEVACRFLAEATAPEVVKEYDVRALLAVLYHYRDWTLARELYWDIEDRLRALGLADTYLD